MNTAVTHAAAVGAIVCVALLGMLFCAVLHGLALLKRFVEISQRAEERRDQQDRIEAVRRFNEQDALGLRESA